MFKLVSVGGLIPLRDEPHNRIVIRKLHYDVAVVSRGAVMHVKSVQQRTRQAALQGAHANAEGLKSMMAHSRPLIATS